jgi:hypothetical protein
MELQIRAYSDLKISEEEQKRITIEYLRRVFYFDSCCVITEDGYVARKYSPRGVERIRGASEADKALSIILENL